MLKALLSEDYPRSRLLTALLVVIVAGLALAPFVFPGIRPLNTAATICVFIVLVASYDLLLGYTGIVSFAHTLFYGIGAYGVALALDAWPASWGAVALGTALGLALAMAIALLIGLFALRVQAIFFAMVTLAVASACLILASQLSGLTGGEDGLTYRVPHLLSPAFRLVDGKVLGVRLDGRIVSYYLLFLAAGALVLAMLRIVNSPFGRVLQAIRENPFRAEALGYRTAVYRTAATVAAAAAAALAGALMALWQKYTGPDTTLSLSIMIDILLMVVIGGMGTIYGAVVGATVFVLAKNYLQLLMAAAAGATAGLPLLPQLVSPDRWLLWLGILFVLSVYFFPSGIVGRLRGRGGEGGAPRG
ncbi:amino acid/amide ABC transporter membrane protein 2, HAAT family [Tistlia consotensis]|uniref:Amino acid/amide ABC transporter membrane protein 2, HAAT family n=1 Tax=Tistlia consotensis USBA 355 TaxID=560819 RepID=A0A1Y6BBH6_9PROT|nr:branched-chain amino acid ABC transporter permease [Tistlia consotensis]SME92163.1 amino acid/amide ABC transporter membrane protein 2, HAAT family [Tistlia consotensis USBA 355]SNR27882.1 amino acid/amide ABC transporter membrane protein 2, HAAT family [Tistlia consotensis]